MPGDMMSYQELVARRDAAKCFRLIVGSVFLSIGTLIICIQFARSGGDLVSQTSEDLKTELDGLSDEKFTRRRLLSSSNSSKISGFKGALIRKPSSCSSSKVGNSSASPSEEARRVGHLRCVLELSSARVNHLLNKKKPDPSVAYGLPRKAMPSTGANAEHPKRMLDNDDQVDSYEAKSWSEGGEYLMHIEIGTPAQKLRGILDTGSDLTWVQCQNCLDCYNEVDPIFDPDNSSTYEEIDCDSDICEDMSTSFCDLFGESCDYLYSYTDTSYTYGTVSEDTFTVDSTDGEGEKVHNMTFGCSHGSSGSFAYTGSDGVVGFGNSEDSFPTQLVAKSGIVDRFSYCLVSRDSDDDVTSPVYFGDAASLSGDGVGYTDILKNDDYKVYYYFKLKGISVAGKRLDLDESIFDIKDDGTGGTIIDSGTTITNLITKAYDKLVDAFDDACKYDRTDSDSGYDVCYDVGDDSDPTFPSLAFHLDGVDLDLPQANYIVDAEEDTECLAIDKSSQNLSVYGNVQQQNYRVLYDRENRRLGFQSTQCDSSD